MTDTLEIKDLHVSVDGKMILKGISFTTKRGEIHVLMGPNGSGKSTLAHALMGHPNYKIEQGQILLNGEDITHLPVDQRARKGLFLSFQYPSEVSGVTLVSFLRTAYNSLKQANVPVMEFHKKILATMDMLKIDHAFAKRYLNEGFSGGEKKKAEMLQLAILEPQFAVIDEVDSGLDRDAIEDVSRSIQTIKKQHNLGIFMITHYNRILQHMTPDKVTIMQDGKIVKEGDGSLAQEIEAKGYEGLVA